MEISLITIYGRVTPETRQQIPKEQLKSNAVQTSPQPKEGTATNDPSVAPLKQQEDLTPINKPVEEQADPQPRTPWLPKLKSWGFESWGEESVNDY